MKLLFITPYFHPSVGGVQNYVLNIGTRLQRDYGLEVVVITSDRSVAAMTRDCTLGIPTYRLPVKLRISNTPVNWQWPTQVRRIIEREQPDVINAHTPVPIISDMAARLRCKIPFVLTYHNDIVKEGLVWSRLAKTYSRMVLGGTLRASEVIITTSKYYSEISPYLRNYAERIEIVPPGVDTRRFNALVDKTWLKKRYPNRKIVLFLGSLERAHNHKGVAVLITSLQRIRRRIPNAMVIVGGSGNAVGDYLALAKRSGVSDSVVFPGFIDDDVLPRYYGGADVFVLPSTSNAEGFGMVLLEASACGTPVVGSDIGGVREAIVDGVDGFLVRPSSPDDLSEAVIKLLSCPELAHRLGQQGSAKALGSWSWECQSRKTYGVLKAALA